MNLKSKLIGLALATAVSLGIVAPAAAAGPSTATNTNLTVNFTDGGNFSVGLSVVSGFSGGPVTASTAAQNLNSTVRITYTDTNAYRGQFHVDLQASNFNSTLQVPYESAGTFYSIPASGLTLVTNYNPQQTRWTSQGCSTAPAGPWPTGVNCMWDYRVGDIGATDQGGTSIGNTPSSTWTANNNLDVARKVAQGWAGSGTALTTHDMALSLLVPAAMPGVTYTSTLTATVVGEMP